MCRPPPSRRSRGRMNLSRAEVHGVHHLLPPLPLAAARARHRAAVPRRGLPQHGHGSARAAYRRRNRLPVRQPGISTAQTVELESVYCLGQCALSPAMMINGTLARESHAAEVRPALCRRPGAHQRGGGNGMTRIYVPCDSSALALGADALAAGDRERSRAARHRNRTGSQWVARPAVARTARRSRDDRRKAASAMRMSRCGRLSRRCSTPGFIDGGAHARTRRRRR